MNKPQSPAVFSGDVLHAIERDPIATYRAYRGMEADELAKLPEHTQKGIVRFVLCGVKPGSFLCSILADEFDLAEKRADNINLPALPAYRDFLENGCPATCWGSPKSVQHWCEVGGLIGVLQKR